MERLDSIDKPNRKPNFTLSQDVDLDKLFREGGEWRLTEGTDYTGSKSAVGKYIRDEFRARYGHCVVPAQSDRDSVIVKITPPGCTCSGDDCTGTCRRGEPMGWDLDPADVLRALEGDSDE